MLPFWRKPPMTTIYSPCAAPGRHADHAATPPARGCLCRVEGPVGVVCRRQRRASGSTHAVWYVFGLEKHARDDRNARIVGDPIPPALQPRKAERRQIGIRPWCRQPAFGSIRDDEAGLRQGVAEIPQGLRALFVDVELFKSVDLGARLGRQRDQWLAVTFAPSAVTPCSASSRSAEARSRSRTGSNGTLSPAAICILLRPKLSSHAAGAGVGAESSAIPGQ